ncbi:unnamed protein product [Rotaria sordida]|uniref:Uncharacterized protein n=1 Tax=Rotaria sordida TaxID=392033 RepID=A0A818KMX7_9BILA|nr:unnamed protein product [Rotaria sordida]CAF3564721.1 unnamed protein product [Rotaria sordida]
MNKLSEINSNCKMNKYAEIDKQNILHQCECTRERRNVLSDVSTVRTNVNTSSPKHYYNQLAERVRELEKEILPDRYFYRISPTYSPFSPVTPCSNVNGFGTSNYPYSLNIPINLISPSSSVPIQPFGLSSKILERAHEIPERFWIHWQQKQMQNRIDELEYIKNKLTSPNEINLTPPTTNQQKNYLLHRNVQDHHISPPQTATFNIITTTNIGNKTSSSNTNNHCSFNFDQQSTDRVNRDNLNDTSSPIKSITSRSSIQKPQSTLDRSRLTIFLPYSYTNISKPTTSTNNHCQLLTKSISEKSTDKKDNTIQTMSSTSNIEDVAQIDTELNLILLLRENRDQTNPLLFSKVTINRTVEFQSLSSNKESSIYQKRNIN